MEKIIESEQDKQAVREVLGYYGIAYREIPTSYKHLQQQIEYLTEPYGMKVRRVRLRRDWFKEASGAMIGFHAGSKEMTALIPGRFGGYTYYDHQLGRRIKMISGTAHVIEPEAILFYRPFPGGKLNVRMLVEYIFKVATVKDSILFCLSTVLVFLISLIFPALVYHFLEYGLLPGRITNMFPIGLLAVCVVISMELVNIYRKRIMYRIHSMVRVSVEAATMMRMLAMPLRFFKRVSVAEQADEMYYMGEICDLLVSCISATLTAVIASIMYFMQIYHYASPLALVSMIVIESMLIYSAILTAVQARASSRQLKKHTVQTRMAYSIFSGIKRIKLTGMEDKAYEKWKKLYLEETESRYSVPILLRVRKVIETALIMIEILLVDVAAIQNHIPASGFFTWIIVFGLLAGTYDRLIQIVIRSARLAPMLDLVGPLMNTELENDRKKLMLTNLKGEIELSHVSFKYEKRSMPILEDISLKINPGEYVAIVGASGSGKSTLMRLLLGFEKPEQGAIYYDGKDMKDVNLHSLRQQMGVVLQTDTLIEGDFLQNLTLTRPWLSLEEVTEITDLVNLTEDIEKMPMGFFTRVSESENDISRGHRQKLMIARALAREASILILDEATSALDNVSQQQISEAIKKLSCTRIVIAHRLSAIKNCDRILVLDQGKICEEGNFDELVQKNGIFAKLVDRQNQVNMVK